MNVEIIAEVAQAHEGSLGMAHAFVDLASECGCDAIKFQVHLAAEESTPEESFRVSGFPQDRTRFDYWSRTQFTLEQWQGLKSHAEDLGMEFIATPFSTRALEWLDILNVRTIKIGSAEAVCFPFLEEVAGLNKRIILSTGLSRPDEIRRGVEILDAGAGAVSLMHCTSAYPCPPQDSGLHLIPQYKAEYSVPVGLSDHSGQLCSAFAGVTLGASLLEVHMTMSKHAFGPDVKASLEPDELKALVRGVRWLEEGLNGRKSKEEMAESLASTRSIFERGLYLSRSIKKGERLSRGDFLFKKPVIGVAANDMYEVLNLEVLRDLTEGEPLRSGDFGRPI